MKEYIRNGKIILEVMPGWIEHCFGNDGFEVECSVHPTIKGNSINPFENELHIAPDGDFMCHECYLKFKSGNTEGLNIDHLKEPDPVFCPHCHETIDTLQEMAS